jgi:putative membrane protein
MRMLLNWILSALLLLVVSHLVPGFVVTSFVAALVAALVIGLINATLGLFLKVITFPITILTFGVFFLAINALMLLLAAKLVPGFEIHGFAPAFWGALLLAILHMVLRWMTPKKRED